jgi:hypothetical protein
VDLNFQTLFSTGRQQPVVPFSVCELLLVATVPFNVLKQMLIIR